MTERTIFLQALDVADPGERARYVESACAGDAALRRQVEELLAAHEREGKFLDVPAVEQVVEQMSASQGTGVTETESGDASDLPLNFLAPSERPDSLGRLGHYEVLEVIGKGGMGTVLRAFDEKLHRVVAIKVMAAELAATSPPRKRFLREARSAAQVRHEHVVDIHAVEEHPIPYLVMEYVAGETLQQKHERVGPFETREILRVGEQIARGLAAAHDKGLIHRDIKPSNILLEKGAEERVKITDFGLARAVADASLTQSGVIAGTPMYMAPEQTVGDSIDHRADLFSLGSVLYTMATGRPPFRATTSMATLKRVAEDHPRPIREIIPEVPEWLCNVIGKLHAKNPEDRFQTAKEVADLLKQHLLHLENPALAPMPASLTPLSPLGRGAGGEGRTSLPSPLGGEGLGVRGRRRWAVAAAVLLCLIGGLSLTEATGVTQLRATVIRIFTPDGTLVVETDDPAVKVTVEGDGGLVITGAGLEEIRLRPGSYRVHADRDGKALPLDKDLVEVTRGGRAIVKVKMEAARALVTAKAEKGAFVLLAGTGVEVRKFDTLAEAVQGASDGDTIEVRGNGPFVTGPFKITRRLTIRSAKGFRPVINLNPEGGLRAEAALVLEGLELRGMGEDAQEGADGFLLASLNSLQVANCRFLGRKGNVCVEARSPICELRNCDFVSEKYAVVAYLSPNQRLVIDNSLMCTDIAITNPEEGFLRLSRNTFLNGTFDFYLLPAEPAIKNLDQQTKVLRAEISGNILGGDWVFRFVQGQPGAILTAAGSEKFLAERLGWQGERNLYSVSGHFLPVYVNPGAAAVLQEPATPLRSLADWRKFWRTTETGSMEGEGAIRFQGGDLLARLEAAPDALTPDDFRLRPDSAGYKAGKDGKDLGADVDLVGPGKAYERWKQTPEYQQWLKDTKQSVVSSQK